MATAVATKKLASPKITAENIAVAAQVAKVLAPPPKPVVIGATTDRMFDLREKKRLLDAAIKVLDDEYAILEEQLMAKLDAEGTTKGAGKKASCSITEAIVANVTDWDAFYAFIAKKKYFHLLQRRTSDAAVRELYEKGLTVPGTVPFTKRRLNLRVSAG